MFIRRFSPHAFELPARTQQANAPRPWVLPAAAFNNRIPGSGVQTSSTPGSALLSPPGRGFHLGNAAQALRDTLHQLAQGMVAPTTTSGSAGQALGRLDVLTVDAGVASTLASTRQVTERSSTARSSALSLGLDTTTPVTRSTLAAAREINETSDTSAQSTTAVALDLDGPEWASTLVATRDVNESTTAARSSSAAIGLDLSAPAASTVSSTGELNTASTSYGTAVHGFSNGSSIATLSGVYAGTGAAAGATSLTIDVGGNANLSTSSSTNLRFKIKDGSGAVLYDHNAAYRAGDSIYLGADIGLSIKFAAGNVRANDASSTTVSTSTPTTVDAGAAFNAGTGLAPRFDGGAQVTAGSFSVNGTSVNVLAGDSISSVLARINSTVSGVTASFAGDKVTLATSGPSEADIVFGADTSGFLAAMKLSGATTTRGNVSDRSQALAGVAAFSAVSSGSFQVNGTAISVNAATDSLDDVITRINGSGAGVTASYDAVTDKVLFTPTDPAASLTLGDDTSGLLAALNVTQGRSGTKVDVNAAFNATGGSAPLFDAGATVGAGSFEVNGVSIAVAANDSLASVLARITGSAAGVDASYDAATDRVSLVSRQNGASPISLQNDSSGLLAALKLTAATGASATAGRASADRERLAQVSAFSGVTSGSLKLNGVTIAVDAAGDSLQAILDRINGSGAGVTASLDRTTKKVSLTPAVAGATLSVGDDTSGLLAALNIQPGVRRSSVNADAAFNAAGAAGPQFDAGVTVGPGSFTVNGIAITVNADDSVNSVLERLNSSAAGVTASLDAASERITLQANAAGPREITLGGDTSGFLAAVKLTAGTGAVSTPGFQRGDQQLFADSATFGSVADGSFRVNGVNIAVSRSTDTLQSVLGRINSAGVGVTARFDETSGRVTIEPGSQGDTLSIEGDSSGFLAAARIAEGTVSGRVNARGAFNGSGANGPLFDDGRTVGSGSFEVNGVAIAVQADDSLESVLARITGSAAGVQARYDETSETIVLTRNTPGPQGITLGNDTSGFLAAAKLDGQLVSTTGRAGSPAVSFDSRIAGSAALAGVGAGTITVNGHAVAVNPASQSVRDVFAALAQVPGIHAELDDATGAIRLNTRAEGGTLDITDTSGLLSALQIAPGQYRGQAAVLTPTQLADPREATRILLAGVDQLNEGLGRMFPRTGTDGAAQAGLRGSLKSLFAELGDRLGGGLGFRDVPRPFIEVDARALETALRTQGADLEDKLAGLHGLAQAIAAASPLPDPPAPVEPAPAPAPRPPLLTNPMDPRLPAEAARTAPAPASRTDSGPMRLEPGLAAAVGRRIQDHKASLVEDTVSQLREGLAEAARREEAARADQAAQAESDKGRLKDEDRERNADGNKERDSRALEGGVARKARDAYEKVRAVGSNGVGGDGFPPRGGTGSPGDGNGSMTAGGRGPQASGAAARFALASSRSRTVVS